MKIIKDQLNAWRSDIINFLTELRLTIHENRAHVYPVEHGIPFLGFTMFPTHRRLKKTKGIAYQRHLKTLWKQFKAGEIRREDGRASVMSWLGHVQHGDTWALQRKMFGQLQ
ncbi:MAG: hypothetical protein MUE54_01235 [Anaerolineae bacterium]|nr:hypothetical protein [Anaerolineae bacterium]